MASPSGYPINPPHLRVGFTERLCYIVGTVDGLKGMSSTLRVLIRREPFETADLIRAYRESGRPFAEDAIAQYGA